MMSVFLIFVIANDHGALFVDQEDVFEFAANDETSTLFTEQEVVFD